MENTRRNFLKKSALLSLSGIAGSLFAKDNLSRLERFNALSGIDPYALPPLPYAYDALEPYIDKETMMLHHGKHHKAYIDKLNSALNASSGEKDILKLLPNVSKLDPSIRNNGGGHYNHSIFWLLMRPFDSTSSILPKGNSARAIKLKYGHIDELKKNFNEAASKVFGSGWCWLIVQNKELKIVTTSNQDNPLMDIVPEIGMPILALDVWEHAYYLKYQNKRIDYINNWWNLVNWDRVETMYNEAMAL